MAEMGEENNIDLHVDTDDLSLFNLKLERFDTDDPPDPEMDALYDTVVTSRGSINDEVIRTEKHLSMDKAGEECPVTEGPGSSENAPSVHKFGVLVGNLTWWTTDLDVENCLRAIGVDDVIDIKFIDNRTNGQSKGYCSVHVGSDRSIRLIHDKLPKRELHDREIMVAAPSKIATAQFESQSDCKPRLPSANMGPTGCNPRSSMLPPPGVSAPPQLYGIPPPPGAPRAVGPRPSRNMNGSDVNSTSGPRLMNMGHPHQRPAPPPMPQHHMNYGPPPPRPHGLPFHPHNPRPTYRPHHQSGHPPYSFPLPPSMDHRVPLPPRPEWMHSAPGPHHCPPVNNQLPPHCPPGVIGHPPTEMNLGSPPGPPLNDGPPAPHVNPAFFQSPYSSSPPIPVSIQEGPPSKVPIRSRDNPQKISTYVPHPHDRPSEDRKPPPPEIDRFPVLNPILSEAEIGEGLSRNRSVSTSAISRAVTDAAKGDFPSAIETLVTAISLIKQSRVGKDDRSKILVTSLQDTLHGIESKSYGRFRDGHMRSSRSRSRERERICGGYRSHHSHSSHHHYRSRSRSRGRSRSRDHYHRERRRSRSLSSSRGREFERSSKFDERDRYREQERERERHKREQEHDRDRERDSGSRSSRVSGNTRSHEESEHHEHRPSRR